MKGGGYMNKNRLESVMKLHGDNGGTLSEYLGISRQQFSRKINDKSAEFTQSEIAMIKEKYDLSPEDIDSIFFDKKVS